MSKWLEMDFKQVFKKLTFQKDDKFFLKASLSHFFSLIMINEREKYKVIDLSQHCITKQIWQLCRMH